MQKTQNESSLLTIWSNGSLIAVSRPSAHAKPTSSATRSRITGFSKASRRRLLRLIAKLRKDALPWFVTLTYPRSYSQNPRRWKRDLKVWAARLRRKYASASFIWRLEFQHRGAPHYHLLVYNIPDSIRRFREWLSQSWYEAVGSDDMKHLKAGTNAQLMRSQRGVMWYASKELGKVSQAILTEEYSDGVGRWWGAYFRKDLPWARQIQLEVSEKDAYEIMRLMRKHADLIPRNYQSLTVFCDADQWLEKLPKMLESLNGELDGGSNSPLSHIVEVERKVREKQQDS